MRKIYSFLFALLTLCGLAQAQTIVTFDATQTLGTNTTASGADEVSLDGITISTTSGGLGTGQQYRFAKSSVTTITSTVGNIISIEFTCTAEGTTKYGPGCFKAQDGYSYQGAIGTWTGSAESVEFTAETAQVRATQIVVTVGSVNPDFVAKPTIRPATGTYYEAQEVTISGAEGTSIFYTIDGSEPTVNSTAYTEPFTVRETTTVKAIAVQGQNKSEVAESIITISQMPEYSSLAEVKKTATAEKVNVMLNLTEVLVSYVNGSSLYLYDGQDGLLIYGSNSDIKAGDKINGTITGQLYLYNGLTEIASPTYSVKVISSDNEIPVQEVAADALVANMKDYENELVIVKELVPNNTAWDNRNVTMEYTDDNDVTTAVVIRDNWRVATDLTFDTNAAYEVTGFLAIYVKDGATTVQLYPRTAEDIFNTEQAGLETPESAWSVATAEVEKGQTVEATFTTTSDGVVTYSSSNEKVATVDAQGVITAVGSGTAVITATTAETETFKASKAEITITVKSDYVLVGDGTLENPYTVADLLSFNATSTKEAVQEDVWVKGVIIGYINGSALNENTAIFSADAPEGVDKQGNPLTVAVSNILIADDETVTDLDAISAVALKADGAARADLNLADNADKLHTTVCLKGDIFKYMGVTGLKNVEEYSLEGSVTLGDVNGDGAVDLTDAIMIVYYSLGSEPAGFNVDAADYNGDGQIDLTDAIEVVYKSLAE